MKFYCLHSSGLASRGFNQAVHIRPFWKHFYGQRSFGFASGGFNVLNNCSTSRHYGPFWERFDVKIVWPFWERFGVKICLALPPANFYQTQISGILSHSDRFLMIKNRLALLPVVLTSSPSSTSRSFLELFMVKTHPDLPTAVFIMLNFKAF